MSTTPLTICPSKLGRRELVVEIGSMPAAMDQAVRAMLPMLLSVMPPEVRFFGIEYDRETTAVAYVAGRACYDIIRLHLGDTWLAESPEQQLRTLCHEIAHAWMVHIEIARTDALNAIVKDAAMREVIEKRDTAARERVAERLGDLLAQACQLMTPVEIPR